MVPKSFDRFIDNLHPTRIMDPVRRGVQQARETFPYKTSRITRWPEFQHWFVLLCRHCEATLLGLHGDVPSCAFEYDWQRLHHYLAAAYGSAGGDKAAFEIARTGSEGGADAVAHAVARAIGNERIDNYISVAVWGYWNSLSTAQKLAAGDWFLEKCGPLYPEELTQDSAARIRANLPQVLMRYPHMLDDLRRAART